MLTIFLFPGKANSSDSQSILQCFLESSAKLGVPIASDKTEGPTTSIIYLGLEIDSDEMIIKMPLQKVQEILTKIQFVRTQKKVNLRVHAEINWRAEFCHSCNCARSPFSSAINKFYMWSK